MNAAAWVGPAQPAVGASAVLPGRSGSVLAPTAAHAAPQPPPSALAAVQLPVIDLPEGGDVVLPLARQQVLTRALLTAIRSVGQSQPWVLMATCRATQVPDKQLYHFLATEYEVLRMALAMLPDEGLLIPARKILDSLLGFDRQ